MVNEDGVKSNKRICSICVLPEDFPGIHFDELGACNFCRLAEGKDESANKKLEYVSRFNAIIKECRGRSTYDALMCYSGGKDSTYTLTVLKEKYGLNILAVSFDNGFLPDQTLDNIRTVVERLGIDHLIFKPRFDVLAKIFRYCAESDVYPRKALERSSSICTSCMGIIKYSALRLCLEKNIPLIAYGWSPGQAPINSSIFKNNPQMIKQMQKAVFDPLYKIVGDDIKPYFLEDRYFVGTHDFPYNINLLAFLDYDIDAIYRRISQLGWKKPEKVDANSTNCFLNSYACFVHKQRLGFHPYAFELASLVRSGHIDRATALKRLSDPEPADTVAMVESKLAYSEAVGSE